jgi:hypothetical protein
MEIKTMLESVLKHEIGQKLLTSLFDDWLSAREASIICGNISAERQRNYTVDRRVLYYFNLLKKHGFLEERKIEKKKQSTSKKGNPRTYTSICSRYRLDLPKLIAFYFTESLVLSSGEKEALSNILKKPAIDKIIRRENRSWEDILTKLVVISITIKVWHLRSEEREIPNFILHEIPSVELLAHFTKGELDEFILEIEKVASTKQPQVFSFTKKIIDAAIPIVLTSKDYDRFVPQTAETVANCAKRAYGNVLSLSLFKSGGYRLHEKRIREAIIAAFTKEPEK